jgi:hypothetical protein
VAEAGERHLDEHRRRHGGLLYHHRRGGKRRRQLLGRRFQHRRQGGQQHRHAHGQHPGPAVPTGLAAAAGNAQITLSWAASAGAASFNIYRSTSPGEVTALNAAGEPGGRPRAERWQPHHGRGPER